MTTGTLLIPVVVDAFDATKLQKTECDDSPADRDLDRLTPPRSEGPEPTRIMTQGFQTKKVPTNYPLVLSHGVLVPAAVSLELACLRTKFAVEDSP